MTAKKAKVKTVPTQADGMRLNRYIARSGIASRRNCDDGIKNGMVTVNGRLTVNPAYKIKTGDTILWDGSAVSLPELFVAVMNKPSGYETTMDKDSSRPVTLLADGMPRAATPVGRLDIRTGGLLLWSNHGELVYRLTHPKWRVEREYSIITAKPVTKDMITKLTKGAYIEPRVFSKPTSVKQTASKKIGVVLKTGRNREVRRLAKICGLALIGLERVRYGTIELGDLERGKWRELSQEETNSLCKIVRLSQ